MYISGYVNGELNMPAIKQLSNLEASQIAAGEVVERPASLIKELIENSLDAGAVNIKITIEHAGSQRISITDDGHGITKSELPLALARHATSKIRSIADLGSILSFGFRGEALASAAAISRLTLTSRANGCDQAWQISTLDVSEDYQIKEVRHQVGTTIDIHDLFFNTPARKKFLKSERTEFSYIEEVFNAFAIIRPDVSFELIHNKKTLKKLASVKDFSQLQSRLTQLLSSQFTNNITYKEFDIGAAWFTHPSFTRSSADLQWLFVNKRLIKDPGLAHAVKRAYQDVLMSGRFPAFILALDIAPDLIDVNIHPNKKMIKFANKDAVYKAVFYAAKSAIAEATSCTKKTDIIEQPMRGFTTDIAEVADVKNAKFSSFNGNINSNKNFTSNLGFNKPNLTSIENIAKEHLQDNPNLTAYIDDHVPEVTREVAVASESSAIDENSTPKLTQQAIGANNLQEPELGYALAQIKGVFILSETSKGVVLVDMHAAHERIIYQSLKKQYQTSGVVMQKLLSAVPVTISAIQYEIIEQKTALIKQFGFEAAIVADTQAVLLAVPALLGKADPKTIFEQFLQELINFDQSNTVAEQIEHILATIGCHSAIRANRSLSVSEMNSLLRQIEQTDYAEACNHGRPTFKKIPMSDLDAIFKRGQ